MASDPDALRLAYHERGQRKALERHLFAYLGDARFNTGNSLLLVGAKWAWMFVSEHQRLIGPLRN